MNTLWIKKDKFPPPPFVTTPINPDRLQQTKRQGISWSLPKIKYDTCSELMRAETILLKYFMNRKGQQLRLEKALMLTNLVNRLGIRWRMNQFYVELVKFKEAFPSAENVKKTKKVKVKANRSADEVRLPSYQWLQWVLYILLREAALLAKIKVECEKTMKYWLGMISSSHHWGDSLIISSIIARIWHVSSIMVEELDAKIYPFLYQLTNVIEPVTASIPWPRSDSEWEVPTTGLLEWLQNCLDIRFEPANLNRTLSTVVEKDNGWVLRVFDDNVNLSSEPATASTSAMVRTSGIMLNEEDDDNDIGIPVPVNLRPAKNKKLKEFRKYWKDFFRNFPAKLTNVAEREILLHTINEHLFTRKNRFGKAVRKTYIEFKPRLKKLGQSIQLYHDDSTNPQHRTKCIKMYKRTKLRLNELLAD